MCVYVSLTDNVLDLGSTYEGDSPSADFLLIGSDDVCYIFANCNWCIGGGSLFYSFWTKVIGLYSASKGA